MNAATTVEAYAAPEAEIAFEIEQEAPKLFSTRGRMGVLKYAAQTLMWTLAFGLVITALFAVTGVISGGASSPSGVIMGVSLILSLPFIFLLCCLAVKRLHDINLSGWFALLTLVPVVGMFFAFYMMLRPGKDEVNRFGAASVTKGWEKVVGGIYVALMVLGSVMMVVGMATGGIAAFMQ